MQVERIGADTARAKPPAKLNLFLEVLGKRADGYHELVSVMQAIDLCDTLTISRVDGDAITIRTQGYPAPADPSNLVVRAAETYFSQGQRRFGLKIDLEKNIPAGAGLGGGSADAAATLAILNTLDEHPLASATLANLAGTIGSDVPFFLTGGAAIARGRGELIEPIPDAAIPAFEFVVVFPGVTSPTPLIYKSLKSDLTTRKRDLHRFLDDLALPTACLRPPFFNALTEPFRTVFPELAHRQDEISRATGRTFHVSGSGSAMFATVEDRQIGNEVRRVLQAMAAGDTFQVRSLHRDPKETGGRSERPSDVPRSE